MAVLPVIPVSPASPASPDIPVPPGAAPVPSTAPVDMGDLRRLQPVDAAFGGGRGRPVDRYYIEAFLEQHRADIRGNVLEVADDHYTQRFGGQQVTASDVLHRDHSNGRATLVGDLADVHSLPPAALGRFDCFICTQTLQYVFDLGAAVATVHRLLRPGGVWLLTVPGISQISPYDRTQWGEHWRFTPQSVQRLLGATFGPASGRVAVQGHGNVLAAVAFLHGLACEDLQPHELAHADDRYPLLVTARAVKQAAPA